MLEMSSYLVRLPEVGYIWVEQTVFVLKCGFHAVFGCSKSRFWWPLMPYLSALCGSDIRFFDDLSAIYAQNGFIHGQIARSRLYLSWALACVLRCGFHAVFGCSKLDSDGRWCHIWVPMAPECHIWALHESEISDFRWFLGHLCLKWLHAWSGCQK